MIDSSHQYEMQKYKFCSPDSSIADSDLIYYAELLLCTSTTTAQVNGRCMYKNHVAVGSEWRHPSWRLRECQ